jgi:predicted phage baseplate assembly protein
MQDRLALLSQRASRSDDAATCCLDEPARRGFEDGSEDAARAILDGFACIADVLTFYQERIANEGYLRTAREERSLRELGRLTGYTPRPGVAASVDVAFTVQSGFDATVPAGTRMQSKPKPGQSAQTFETSAALDARAQWNAMRPRQRSSQGFVRAEQAPGGIDNNGARLDRATGRIEIFLKGVDQNVRAGDLIMLEPAPGAHESAWAPSAEDLFRVERVQAAPASGQTTVRLVPASGGYDIGYWDDRATGSGLRLLARPNNARSPAATVARVAISSRVATQRALAALRSPLSDAQDDTATDASKRLRTLEPTAVRLALGTPGGKDLLAESLPLALRSRVLDVLQQTAAPVMPRAYVFRASAQPFGFNAPKLAKVTQARDPNSDGVVSSTTYSLQPLFEDEQPDVVFLDGEHPRTLANQWIVASVPVTYTRSNEGRLGAPTRVLSVLDVREVEVLARQAYELTGRATKLTLNTAWRANDDGAGSTDVLAQTVFYIDPEQLTLIEAPLDRDVCGSTMLLDGAIDELPAGRKLIVEGELADFPELSGQRMAEPVEVLRSWTAVGDDLSAASASGAPSTAFEFSPPLKHCYKRSSVVIYGNVAQATHGETREQILGSGDASLANQTFALKQGPRTWAPAETSNGIASTLEVRVRGILWPELSSLLDAGPRSEVVLTRTGSDRLDRVVGGDGVRGARFPSGVENVVARYRVGLGTEGNVDAGSIVNLSTKPLGVQSVLNPRAATGGAGPDGAEAMRERIPIAARGQDRLVSIGDYEDFALNFAGIQHAHAIAGERGAPSVQLIVTGAEGASVDATLDKLRAATRRYGDPAVRLDLSQARSEPVQLEASLRVDPRYRFDDVASAVRGALVSALGFAARAIGQPLSLSRVLTVMQRAEGVLAVDVDAFRTLGKSTPLQPLTLSERANELAAALADANTSALQVPPRLEVAPDVLLYFAADAPENIVLKEVAP